jgi:hypothetical protein
MFNGICWEIIRLISTLTIHHRLFTILTMVFDHPAFPASLAPRDYRVPIPHFATNCLTYSASGENAQKVVELGRR